MDNAEQNSKSAPCIRLSVRRIVELALRCGDIDSRFAEADVMRKGSKAHRKLQKSMGEGYKSEVALSIKTEAAGIPVTVYGRADGIIAHEDTSFTIDEIKTTTLTLDELYSQRALHEGQAKCYAMMLCADMPEKPPKIIIQLTYYQLETGELKRYLSDYTFNEIETFWHNMLGKYGEFLGFEQEWAGVRDKSAKALSFPYENYRKGQREMAVACYKSIEKGKKLYAQAPTGIGKTLSALFPAIKAVGENKAGKLFYLTAKTVTRKAPEDSVRLMLENGLRFKSLTLRAKEKICLNHSLSCNPVMCAFAKGHYDRINKALLDLLRANDLITPDIVCGYAEKHQVCPFEMSLDLSLWADLVICDYNHVFDPVVYLKRFFSDSGGEYVFLIDEAHNLADRVRDMYTVSIKKSELASLKAKLKDKTKPAVNLRRRITAMNKRLDALCGAMGGENSSVSTNQDAELTALTYSFSMACDEWLGSIKNTSHPAQEELLAVYFNALEFLNISELFNSRYAAITEAFGRNVKYTLFCLDPSEIIKARLALAKSSVVFSATLTPLSYHMEVLGGGENDAAIALASPFDQNKLLLLAHRGLSTKYADRDVSLDHVAEAIHVAVSKKRGNYIAYFPSYEYLLRVYEVFTDRYPNVRTAVQDRAMGEEARVRFLDGFDANNEETLTGFCVMGGIFSEGIDLKGERLIGSVIVGVGLPKISLRQDLIRNYYDGVNGHGYDYAYVFPGMNKVLQAAGRVIRGEDDYGLALLIDQRFGTPKYKAMYPDFWSHMRMINSNRDLEEAVDGFDYFE